MRLPSESSPDWLLRASSAELCLQPPVIRDEDVVWLEIAVDDALVVSDGEPASDLLGVVNRLANGQRAGTQSLAQGGAIQQFADNVR